MNNEVLAGGIGANKDLDKNCGRNPLMKDLSQDVSAADSTTGILFPRQCCSLRAAPSCSFQQWGHLKRSVETRATKSGEDSRATGLYEIRVFKHVFTKAVDGNSARFPQYLDRSQEVGTLNGSG